MKILKTKMVLFMMAFLLTTTIAIAQSPQRLSPEQRAAEATEKMAVELSLTEEQKTKIHEINLRYAQSMQPARAQSKEAAAAKKTQLQSKDSEIKALLTEEQHVKYEAMKKEAMEQRKAKKP